MTETIEYLAYIMKEAKKNGTPKPIVFLGAGASRSAGIPDANTIALNILKEYADNPKIKNLKEEEKTYATLMATLTPDQSKKLLKELIDDAKINVTHIYLAQMMKEGFIDYFLTVNFDNLMQRALALFNMFPPTYDMSIFRDITTSSFHPQSITYLHGQHNGQWLLNTEIEMAKPKEAISAILHQIKNGRTWIIIGYSGTDPIFDHISNLGRFDNGLYWIGYKDNHPNPRITEHLLDSPQLNAHLIQGYDSDSFCLKLNTELGNPEPIIFDKPFSFLKDVQNNIVDIEDSEIYKDVKERLDESKKMVEDSIHKYENGDFKKEKMSEQEISISNLKLEIINTIIKKDYSQADALLEQANKFNNPELKRLLSSLFDNWGNKLSLSINDVSETEKKKELILEALSKYEKAASIDKNSNELYFNWGTTLTKIAKISQGEEQLHYYKSAIEKFEESIKLNPKNSKSFFNWANALSDIAELNNDSVEAKKYFELSFAKYQQAIKINDKYDKAYNNYAVSLSKYAELLDEDQKQKYLNKALTMSKKAFIINEMVYNIACSHALLNNKSKALEYLDLAMKNKEQTKNSVISDSDWNHFLIDEDFLAIINKYQ